MPAYFLDQQKASVGLVANMGFATMNWNINRSRNTDDKACPLSNLLIRKS